MDKRPVKIYYYAFLVVLSTFLCSFFIFYFPESDGDGNSYRLIADNILRGCGVSMSPINSQVCVPHFGGNHGPGYPVFMALIWALSGHSDFAIRIFQALIYTASIIYLVENINRYTSSLKISVIVGFVLVISPLHIGWSRFILSEALAIAGTLWVFAEIIRSLHIQKLRTISLAFALIFTSFIRLDAILILIPIVITAFIIHTPREAFKKVIFGAIIFALPWTGWLTRNYIVGLENLFEPMAAELVNETPGVFDWTRSWSTHQYSTIAVHFPIYSYDYDEIVVDNEAYSSENEKKSVNILLDELVKYKSKPFPSHIDVQFAELAKQRKTSNPVRHYLILPIKRVINFWLNLNAGYGLPGFGENLSNKDRIELVNGDLKQKLFKITEYPFIIISRLFAQSWKLALYVGFIAACWISVRDKNFEYRNLVFIVMSFIVTRSIATGVLNLTEARFSVTQMPLLEVMIVLTFWGFLKNHNIEKNHWQQN